MIWRSAAALWTRWSSSAASRLLLLQGSEASSSRHCHHALGSHPHAASGACHAAGPTTPHAEASSSTRRDDFDDVLVKPEVTAPGKADARDIRLRSQAAFFTVAAPTSRQASSALLSQMSGCRSRIGGYRGLRNVSSVMGGGAAEGGTDAEVVDAEVVVPKGFVRPESPLGAAAAAAMAPNSASASTADRSMLLPKEHILPVAAYHIGMRLNFYQLAQSQFFFDCPRALNRDSIIFTLPRHRDVVPGIMAGGAPDKYMAVFRYGSVVFFGVSNPQERLQLIQMCEEVAEMPVSKPQMEEFAVVVRPSLPTWSEMQTDHVILKVLDTNSIRVISSVLGQSVALDSYASKVDSSLEAFSNLNREMERTGTFTIRKESLFRLVAQNNILITEIMTKLGLLERSDTAWKYAQYGPIWEGLRVEFELDTRFHTLDRKVNLIQDNVKYFLEILQNRKSDTLEWTIIVLIAAEIVLGLYDIFIKTAT